VPTASQSRIKKKRSNNRKLFSAFIEVGKESRNWPTILKIMKHETQHIYNSTYYMISIHCNTYAVISISYRQVDRGTAYNKNKKNMIWNYLCKIIKAKTIP
jgi:hypothetical protein